jgi:hypothetical protein
MPVHVWFAHPRQNEIDGSPDASTSVNGRSRMRDPLPNQ